MNNIETELSCSDCLYCEDCDGKSPCSFFCPTNCVVLNETNNREEFMRQWEIYAKQYE